MVDQQLTQVYKNRFTNQVITENTVIYNIFSVFATFFTEITCTLVVIFSLVFRLSLSMLIFMVIYLFYYYHLHRILDDFVN